MRFAGHEVVVECGELGPAGRIGHRAGHDVSPEKFVGVGGGERTGCQTGRPCDRLKLVDGSGRINTFEFGDEDFVIGWCGGGRAGDRGGTASDIGRNICSRADGRRVSFRTISAQTCHQRRQRHP